ncbi:MAG: hypothetical protein CFE43_12770 [Burkholderiales bacterium PBB3]|nr:MAG: hypothetical protein CFE43_12770 [Burkholderiales bacterium PBB3]
MSQQPRHGDGNDGKPDTLRDARLAQALKHMPDAHMQPDPQTRNAVLQAALKALEDAPETPKQANNAVDTQPQVDGVPGWRKAWHWLLGQPGQRVPLTGALASLLIASFVTVMWLGQEVPDANPESVSVAEANYGGKTEKAAKAENASASPSPSNTTAQQATEPPQASAPPAARAVLTPAPAPAPAPSPTAAPAAPPAQGLAQPPVAVAAPKAVASIQSAANLPAPPSPPPTPPAPAKESAAERSDARLQSAQMTQMAPMADAAKPAAKMAAPTPTAPAVAATAAPPPAPAPVVAAAPAPAAPPPLAESAARARRDAATSPGLQVVLDGQRRTLTAAQSASLLASLRALPWQVESSRTGAAIGNNGLLADSATPFTVQTPDGERWEISASSVRASTAGIVSTSPLTPAQWLQLRALAAPAAP